MDKSKRIIAVLLIIITILVIALVGAIVYIVMEKDNNSNNQAMVNTSGYDEDDMYNEINNEIDEDDMVDKVENMARQTFNAKFTVYEGSEMTALQIKSLLSAIEANNAVESSKTNIEEQHLVTLDGTGITKKEQIDNTKKYNVELSYDDDEYVNSIKITEYTGTTGNNGQQPGDMEKVIFNTQFTSYLGDITGSELKVLIQKVTASNIANPEHQVTGSSNNMPNLNEIVETDIYTITLSYDTNGYVNNINIDKKI